MMVEVEVVEKSVFFFLRVCFFSLKIAIVGLWRSVLV